MFDEMTQEQLLNKIEDIALFLDNNNIHKAMCILSSEQLNRVVFQNSIKEIK